MSCLGAWLGGEVGWGGRRCCRENWHYPPQCTCMCICALDNWMKAHTDTVPHSVFLYVYLCMCMCMCVCTRTLVWQERGGFPLLLNSEDNSEDDPKQPLNFKLWVAVRACCASLTALPTIARLRPVLGYLSSSLGLTLACDMLLELQFASFLSCCSRSILLLPAKPH